MTSQNDRNTDALLDLIDGTVEAWETSPDAVRHVPDNERTVSPDDGFGEAIHVYTRAQAIADGILVEVPEDLDRDAGFRVPVALTRAAWLDCVTWSDQDSRRKGGLPQDETGRLWDVLWMARSAARGVEGDQTPFRLYRVRREGRGVRPRLVMLVAHIGPGDEGEPVVTIMQPGED